MIPEIEWVDVIPDALRVDVLLRWFVGRYCPQNVSG